MCNNGEDQGMVNGDEAINRVVNDFSFKGAHPVVELLNQLIKWQAKVQISSTFWQNEIDLLFYRFIVLNPALIASIYTQRSF